MNEEALYAWALNVHLECMGRPEEKIDIVMGGEILDLRDLKTILDHTLRVEHLPSDQ